MREDMQAVRSSRSAWRRAAQVLLNHQGVVLASGAIPCSQMRRALLVDQVLLPDLEPLLAGRQEGPAPLRESRCCGAVLAAGGLQIRARGAVPAPRSPCAWPSSGPCRRSRIPAPLRLPSGLLSWAGIRLFGVGHPETPYCKSVPNAMVGPGGYWPNGLVGPRTHPDIEMRAVNSNFQ
jgi:hypothetical protein